MRIGGVLLVLAFARDAAAQARMLVERDAPAPEMEPDRSVLFVQRLDDVNGDTVTMVIQPHFRIDTGGARFALLTVTPGPALAQAEPENVFVDLEAATAPEVDDVVQEIEDPSLGYECTSIDVPGCGAGLGGGRGGTTITPPPPPDFGVDAGMPVQTIGSYEIAQTQVATTTDLSTWLDGLSYVYDASDLDAIAPYLALGWNVVAVRVATDAPLDGALVPVALSWPGHDLRVPLGVSQQATPMPVTFPVYIAARHRFDVQGAYQSFAGWASRDGVPFLTRNDVTVDLTAGADADPFALESDGDAEWRDVVTITHQELVPVQHCPPSSSPPPDDDDGCICNARGGGRGGAAANLVLLALATIVVTVRRRR